jgi:succinate dehydrogenase flavin-adding protein (antitoxin of CptAB toxin-antitoxin module)
VRGGSVFDDARAVRMRRIAWNCRRGLLELDIVLGRFVASALPRLSDQETLELQDLLQLADNDLWDLIAGRAVCADPRLAPLVARLQRV